MKKGLLLFALFTGTAIGNIHAQQDKALTHFIFDRTTFNPAATALTQNSICGTFIYRNQWDKINGAPNSGTFNVEADVDQYIPNLFGGISFFQDMIGFNRQNLATLNVGYSLKNILPVDLRIGVGFGIMNYSVTPDWLPPQTLADPTLPTAYASTKFDANLGLYLRHTLATGDEFNVGLSTTHLPAPLHTNAAVTSTPNTLGFNTARHFYFMGGYKFVDALPAGDAVDVNLMVQSDIVKTSFGMNARYVWQDQAYGGLTFRSEDMVGVMLGVDPLAFMETSVKGKFWVGYAYDFTINKLSSISQGSHEVFARYCYPLPRIPLTVTKHPRWL